MRVFSADVSISVPAPGWCTVGVEQGEDGAVMEKRDALKSFAPVTQRVLGPATTFSTRVVRYNVRRM
jgi:hypothetical protein